MSESDSMISINATIDIAASTLQTIVENAKQLAGPDAKGIYRVDPAEHVNALVTDFLHQFDFDAYAADITHYHR